MKIRLNEIPHDGRSYTFNRETGELNEVLTDLVHDHDYDVELFIKPMGNAYEMKGKVQTAVTEVCSSCGWDFDLPIDRKIHEILFEEAPEDYRKSHSVHGNQSVDFLAEGPSMTPYRGDVFDAGDFVHEVIALEEPFYPLCGGEVCKRADEAREIQQRLNEQFSGAEEKTTGRSAFAALKGLSFGEKN